MPPRRKGRGPSRPASSPLGNTAEDALITRDAHEKATVKPQVLQQDAWTDDQEAVLFKGMIRWKPSHGYTPSEHEHTRIPGIWKKLGSLYNLEALDDRENAFSRASSPDDAENKNSSYQFSLPNDEYGKMIFDRRLAPAGSSSPPTSIRPPSAGGTSMAATRRASTIEDTEDVRSSPASARGGRMTGSARQTRSTRRSQLQEVSKIPERKGGSKVSPNEESMDEPKEEEAEAPVETEEAEEEEHHALDGATKPSSTRFIRRRSGRRK
ncbi:MAG: hypothetical protein Q9213_001484 [Squamulea squamosa]